MKVHLNLAGIELRKFENKWSQRKGLFTRELPDDVFMIVEEYLDFAYVDDAGIFHVPVHHFGRYIKVVDELMEGISSGGVTARGVSDHLKSLLKKL